VIDRTRCSATLREEELFTARGYIALGLFSAWVETPETELRFGGWDDPKELEDALAWAREHAGQVRIDVIGQDTWDRYSAGDVTIDSLPPLPAGFTVTRRAHPRSAQMEPPLFPTPHPTLDGLGPTPFDDPSA
jgi:hypothetical protein